MSRERQELLSRGALGVFRLNGQFLSVADELAVPAGLTAAWWQVLGAVLRDPLPVAAVAGRALIVEAVRPIPARASARARALRGVAGMDVPFPRL